MLWGEIEKSAAISKAVFHIVKSNLQRHRKFERIPVQAYVDKQQMSN